MKQQKQESITKAQCRESLSKVIDEELINLPSLLASLSPKERAGLLCKLLPFVMEKEEPTVKGLWD